MMNKVSLILTTYNSMENLKATLESIESQTYPLMEIIIKDGNSTDGTVDIIKSYARRSKYKIRWISCPDIGIYDAMNQGYALSTGDIVAFFNDTFTKNDAVQKIVDVIEKTTDCVGAHADLVYATDNKVVRYWKMGPQKSIYMGWMPGHPTLFLKREIYEEYGLYKTNYKISADYEFMIRFLKDKRNRLAYLPEILVRMYYGGTSTSDVRSYIESLKEGHRALKENSVHCAWVVDMTRTIRVLLQFIKK